MTESTALARARAGDEEAFRSPVGPYRRELQVHCDRILGSLQDAEDLLQETLVAAWRGLDKFDGRASMRSWLYRIATNRCLNARRDSGRRALEPRTHLPALTRMTEPPWLEPYPDVMLEGIGDLSPGPGCLIGATTRHRIDCGEQKRSRGSLDAAGAGRGS